MKTLGSMFVVASLLAVATPASAAGRGLLLAPGELRPAVRDGLAAQVAQAREQNPRAFAAVARLRADLPVLDQRKRGGLVPVSMLLRPMGQDALFPLVAELAFDGDASDLSPSAAAAWKVGVLETLGMLRDARAEPLYVAVLDGAETSAPIVRAAAEALARLGTDAARDALVARARVASPKKLAILSGMGSCRRAQVAEVLAANLAKAEDDATITTLARALADVGNAWAWQTPNGGAKAEESAVRTTAAKALLAAYLRAQGDAQASVANAFLVVDAPASRKLLGAAGGSATADQKAALAALETRLANNPTR